MVKSKLVMNGVMKIIAKTFHLDEILDYVKNPNELDIQMKQAFKLIGKQGKTIEELEKKVAILEKEISILKADSHPPAFTQDTLDEIYQRLGELENNG